MEHKHGPKTDTHDEHAHEHSGGHTHSHVHRHLERRRLLASMVLTGAMLVVELVGGIISGSLALISDAGHMFTHCFALGISFFAIIMALRPAPRERSFGFYRMEILAAFTNGLVLVGVTVYIVYESVARFLNPTPIAEMQMLVVAVAGLVVNLISALLLAGVGKDDLNVRSAFLHMLGDTLSSVAVVGGAILIHYTGWIRIDPILSALIAVMIGIWSYRLLRDSANILLESTPKHIDLGRLEEAIMAEFDEIKSLHDLHVWEITSGMHTMTAHVGIEPGTSVEGAENLRRRLEEFLEKGFRIGHTALQFESARGCCSDKPGDPCCVGSDGHGNSTPAPAP
ncbi:MAG: cation diffusion facilitator family transporter [Phycisphaerae bacterium]|nr:cation diffusion facilitator family transporter [Phycisphaerae bacterium]